MLVLYSSIYTDSDYPAPLRLLWYIQTQDYNTDKYCKSAHLEILLTNIASVSNVNIVCYSKPQPTRYHISHWHFAQCLDSKPSILGTGSSDRAQTYKTWRQHHLQNVGYVHCFLFVWSFIVLVILQFLYRWKE